MITKNQVENSQEKWGNGVVKIGSLKQNRAECEKLLDGLSKEEL